jgi:hypothetical protein
MEQNPVFAISDLSENTRPSGLFETLKSFIQVIVIMWAWWILKPRRLLHIHVFLLNTVKKHVLYIQLVKTPSLRYNN